MASDSVPIPGAIGLPRESGKTWLEIVHEWVITVDHKKLGLMYIGYGAAIPCDRRDRGHAIMRIQLAVPPLRTLFRRKYSTACSRCTAPR